jgi:hypothetical protein
VTIGSGGIPQSGSNNVTLFRDQSIALKIVVKNADGSIVQTIDPIPATSSFDQTSSDKLDGIEAGADITDSGNVTPLLSGTQEMFIRPQDMYLPTTGAAGALAQVEGTASMPNYSGYPFSGTDATQEYLEFVVAFRKMYDLANITAQIYWTSAATDTDGVAWNIRAVALSDSDPFAQTYGTPTTITDTLLGAAGDLHITAASSVAIGGNVADGDLVAFRIGRDPDNASDTAAEDCVVVGCKLRWERDALTDD